MVEKWIRGSPGSFQGISVYISERSRSVELRGANEGGGGAALPGGRCRGSNSESDVGG